MSEINKRELDNYITGEPPQLEDMDKEELLDVIEELSKQIDDYRKQLAISKERIVKVFKRHFNFKGLGLYGDEMVRKFETIIDEILGDDKNV